jgi:hypothetical protein
VNDQNDERRPARNAAATTTSTVTITSPTTGVQVATLAIVAQLEALRDQMGAREYVVLVDLVGRWVDEERRRIRFSLRRWVA